MTEFISNLKETCKNISSKLNINKYDIFGIIKEENSASAKGGKPFALTASSKNSVTVRVWNNNQQVGIASTSNLTKEGLTIAFEIALNSAQFSSSNTPYDFSPLCSEKIIFNNIEHEFKFASIQNLANAAIECEKYLLNSHPSIKSVPYNKVGQSCHEKFYFNSSNAFRYQKTTSALCYFYPLAQEENKVPRQLGHVNLTHNFEELNYLECAKKALEKTKNHLNYKKINSGKYTVIFSPESFLDILEAFSNFFNAQNVLDNKSLSRKETLNTQLAPDYVNIVDCPLHNEHIGKPYFDEEGTPTSQLTILENGVLKNFIHTSHTAKIFSTKPTGHTSIGSKLTAHAHFLRVFASSNHCENAIQIPENCIYIEEVKALHAGINALQGSFSLPFDGFIMNDNKQISIESATVAGDFLTLLKNIIYLSSEERTTPSGICPDVWVKDLSITGT